jgi:hypothetical protein
MIVILGLVILVAAAIVGVAGVLGNGGSAHALTDGFSVFGYHVTGSTGTLFLYGIVVGAVAMFGLSLLLAGARRTSRRSRAARRGLIQSRRETAAVRKDRDDLIDQRETARAQTASGLGNATPRGDRQLNPDDDRRSRPRLFGHRSAPRPAAAAHPDSLTGRRAPDVPADAPAPQK